MRALVLASFILLSVPSFGHCDSDLDSQLVNNYLSALQGRDETEILSSWKAISTNPETQKFMQANYPDAYSSWRIKGYDVALGQALSEYQDKYSDTETISGSDGLSVPDFYVSEPMNNNERAPLSLNKDQPTNSEIVERSLQANTLSNGEIAGRHPNQDQQTNQSYINNRVRAMIPEKPTADQAP